MYISTYFSYAQYLWEHKKRLVSLVGEREVGVWAQAEEEDFSLYTLVPFQKYIFKKSIHTPKKNVHIVLFIMAKKYQQLMSIH